LSGGTEKPTAAFVLSLIGGIIVLLVGLVAAAIGAAFTMFIGGIGGIFGLIGALWGVLMIVGAFKLNSDPNSHTTWGTLIIVFSFLSWFGAFGGAFIGFLLGLIGGILALTFNPRSAASPVPTAVQQPITRICPNCGRVLQEDTKFCPGCGKQLP